MSGQYEPAERAYYDRLFASIDKDNSGVLPGQDALPFLMSSGLPQQLLGEVWALADPSNNGFLTQDGWYKAARLIGWLQSGRTLDDTLMNEAGPYPTFAGHTPPSSATHPTTLPPISPADRTKFTRIFVGCNPVNGLITGEKARDVFLKSQLGYEKLGQIWNLADTRQRGSLDLTDFIIGMHLIQSCMANPSLSLPPVLPSGIYEQASGGRPQANPLTPQRTGASIRAQNTGPASPVHPQHTGNPTRAFPVQSSSSAWDVTPEAKATSDQFFAQLDPQNKGTIEGDVAVPFMVQSQLDEGTLATIWDLADIKHEGKLDRDQFAVAMHLINNKLAGKDVPNSLPTSLIPPSLRGQPPSMDRDLFDLFDDTPSTSVQTPSAFTKASSPKPNPAPRSPPPPPVRPIQQRDLLGEDAPTVPQDSVQVGNLRNELDNTNRAVESVSSIRKDLEGRENSNKEQITDLEAKLADAKSRHQTETKAVDDLRARVTDQGVILTKLQAEVISAESDISALKSEKSELEQALLKDKEEVRELQRRMKAADEEKNALRVVLEKLRKESRQQKGLVTIAKKQVTTAESSRDIVQLDIDAEAAAAASVPLPHTPQALSPAPTGMSQRSNNPFDRLNRASTGSTGGAATGAVASAVPGIVAAPEIQHVVASTAGEASLKARAVEGELPTQTRPSEDPFEANRTQSGAVTGAETESTGDATRENVAPPSASGLDIRPTGAVNEFDTAFVGLDTEPAEQLPDGAAAASGVNEVPSMNAELPALLATHDQLPGTPPIQSFDAAENELTVDQNLLEEEHLSNQHRVGEEQSPVASSDEEEGPEDLESPSIYTTPSDPRLARRSAPPPPPPARNVDELDPFGASSKRISHPPVDGNSTVNFDDDDFDFSDLPPAKLEDRADTRATFDDEFAGFDDEFGPSHIQSASVVTVASGTQEPIPTRSFDEWGAIPGQKSAPAALSFEDAFGSQSFPDEGVDVKTALSSTQPGQPPVRNEGVAQADDIEDVKKLCAMGFPRSLVVDALDANGYDFQKTLNVLLAQ